jgi:rare lipoprotein A (peptidoglycan hydrolase)
MLRTARVVPAIATQRAPQTIRAPERSAERCGLLQLRMIARMTEQVSSALRHEVETKRQMSRLCSLANGQINNGTDQSRHCVRAAGRPATITTGAWLRALARKALPAARPARGRSPLSGLVSYYWEPRQVASGGNFDPSGMTCAHRTLPFGTYLRVSDPKTGRSIVVTVNDRGPFVQGRVLDLSLGAARALGMIDRGVMLVSANVL